MPTSKVKTQFIFAPIVRLDEEQRIVEGYAFVNPSVKGDTYSVSRKAMEDATPEYMRWGAVRSMHQLLAAGTAESVIWDENGALIRAHIVDDQEWRKVQAKVYKGFSIGVRPQLVRGNSVEKLTWVENSLVDRPKDPDAIFTVARAEGFDPDEEFECEVEEVEPAISRDAANELIQRNGNAITRYQVGDEVRLLRDASNGAVSAGSLGTVTMDEGNTGVQGRWEVQPGVFNLQAYPRQDIERATVAEDGVANADPDEEGYRPVKASDCTITREGDLFVLNGPDGALIGKFETEAEARARAAEVADAMKDGDGGKDDATDQHGTTLVLPTDRAEEPTIAEGEELDLTRTEDGSAWNVIRQSNGEVVHQAESIEAAGAWIKAALARAVTASTPSLPVRENLEGKTPKEERANDGDADDEKAAMKCRVCGTPYVRGDEAEVERAESEETKEKEKGHDSPPEGYPKDKEKYADPKNFKYPIETEAHVRAALAYFAKPKNRDEYSADEQKAIEGRIHAAAKKFGIEVSDDKERADEPTLTDLPQIIARLETDNAASVLRAETAETELARVQTAQEATSRDLASAKEQITRLEAMPVATPPLRFAHAVTREFFANAKLDHDGETARIETRMNEIIAMPPTSDPEEQTKRIVEIGLLKMQLASRAA